MRDFNVQLIKGNWYFFSSSFFCFTSDLIALRRSLLSAEIFQLGWNSATQLDE